MFQKFFLGFQLYRVQFVIIFLGKFFVFFRNCFVGFFCFGIVSLQEWRELCFMCGFGVFFRGFQRELFGMVYFYLSYFFRFFFFRFFQDVCVWNYIVSKWEVIIGIQVFLILKFENQDGRQVVVWIEKEIEEKVGGGRKREVER